MAPGVMKIAFLFCALLGSAQGALLTRGRASSHLISQGNSVSRVVGLLKNLEAKLEKEGEAEKDLYDKFVCWATSTVESKTKSITEAKARIGVQEKFIADVEGGVMTFTSEKERLEGELASLKDELQNMSEARRNAHNAFLKQQQENEEAVQGLDVAEKTLKDAAAASSSTGLLALRGTTEKEKSRGALGRKEHAEKLRKALKVGDEYLSKADAAILRLAVSGRKFSDHEEPEQYTTQTGNVIQTLDTIEYGIRKDLKEDEAVEKQTQLNFDKQFKTKQEQEAALEDSLSKLEEEFAARAEAMEEAKQEVANLKDQNTVDQNLVDTTNEALTTKSAEWDKRLAYRQGELEALEKAIQELTSDDARDLFHSTLSFLQTSETLNEDMLASRARSASFTLGAAAKASKDPRLMALAAAVSDVQHVKLKSGPVFDAANDANITNENFDEVLGKINDMKTALRVEEKDDFSKKETCEKELTENEAEKLSKERAIETESTSIDFNEGKIKELQSEIDHKAVGITEVEGQLEDAAKLRDAEAAEYAEAKKNDQDAVVLIQKAAKFITDFYASQKGAGTSFLQTNVAKAAQPLPDELQKAGAPSVWKEAEYSGAGAQSAGVVQTIQMVADEVKKEIAVADKEESEAIAAYRKTKDELEKEKEDLEGLKEQLVIKKGNREDENAEAREEVATLTNQLKAVEKTMADVKPHCDFYLVNFEVRQRNRNTELKGLDKAMAILKGAVFEDKSRRLTVKDS